MFRGNVGKSTWQTAKRIARALGIDVMTRKGRDAFAQNCHSEYLELLAASRNVGLPANPKRMALIAQLNGTNPTEAAHLIVCLAETRTLTGDVCECGVGTGATSALIAAELRGTGKRLWLYDTFAGLPEPTFEDRLIDDILRLGSMQAYTGRMNHAQSEVRNRLRAIGISGDAYRMVPGLFETSVNASLLPDRISFAYIDFDFYAPIKLALHAISARLEPGGIILIDDYGYFSAGAQTAVDEFIEDRHGDYAIEIPRYCREHFAIVRSVATPSHAVEAK